MDEIVKKLTASGVSNEIIQQLKDGLGNTFETELVNNWLKMAAQKVGIDPSELPYIDFKKVGEAVQELVGKDMDKDGKTGITEALQDVKEAFTHTHEETKKNVTNGFQWVSSKIKSWFSK